MPISRAQGPLFYADSAGLDGENGRPAGNRYVDGLVDRSVRNRKQLQRQKGESYRRSNRLCVEHMSGGTHPGTQNRTMCGVAVMCVVRFVRDQLARGETADDQQTDH